MAKTSIEWTDDSWNPVAGCSVISPGCKNCYAMRLARRLEFMGQEKYRGLTKEVNGRAVWTGDVGLDEQHLLAPLRWKKPRRVFVNSMSDLFHEKVPDNYIDRVYAVMALCPQHVFQVLTKRPERMQNYCQPAATAARVWEIADALAPYVQKRRIWPLRNVWAGTSIEDTPRLSRLNHLLKTPAAVRFVSYEPAIAEVDFCMRNWADLQREDCRLDWIIVGGESGPNARPFDLNWARLVVDDARTAGVACFVKQLGAHAFDYRDPPAGGGSPGFDLRYEVKLRHPAGADPKEWPAALRVREFPGGLFSGAVVAGTCKICGCTEDNACPGGCAWIDGSRTLCSECLMQSAMGGQRA